MSRPTPFQVVAEPHLLYAHTTVETCGKFLGVYRSRAVRDTDAVYAPVAELLSEHESVRLTHEIVSDENMLFGSADLTTYMLRNREGKA